MRPTANAAEHLAAVGLDPAARQLQQQLQAARDRLVALESERRRLIDTSLSALAFCTPSEVGQASGLQSPASLASVAARSARSPSSTGMAFAAAKGNLAAADGAVLADGGPDALERPPWLLADGRLLTACLEGENRALKRAVSRARLEIDELMKRRCAAEARAQALEAENQAAAQALRRCTTLSSVGRVATDPQVVAEGSQQVAQQCAVGSGSVDGAAAAVSLRRLVLQPGTAVPVAAGPDVEHVAEPVAEPPPEGRPGSASAGLPAAGQERQEHDARCRLLETSEEIGRRMEEILSRRGKLHTALDAETETTDAGSTAPSGESAEGSAASHNSAPAGAGGTY